MKKTIAFILIILITFFLGIVINKNQNIDLMNKSIRYCNDLGYEKNLLNSREKFGEFDINLTISKERKWKKIVIMNQLSAIENSSFTYDPDYTPVTLIIKNKHGLNCKLLAEIKPHGDLADHFVVFKPGANTIYDLPSLKVKILDGNIFGIVEFRLFIPKTRNNSNEIFVTTLLEKLDIYAPRTTFINVNYNNKTTKYIFQEKINKEFLENNLLQEGLIFSGDERFVFKYKEDAIDSEESGISKHKLSDPKFLINNKINTSMAMKALQVLNEASFFYSSKINQATAVDYYTSQNRSMYQKYFLDVPKFDAIISAINARHNLSRDDRRFYYDSVNKSFIPLYYDGMVNILDQNNKLILNNPNFDLSIHHNKNQNEILNSAKAGSELALNSVYKIDIQKLKLSLEERGLTIIEKDLIEIIEIIKKNLLIIKDKPDNKFIKVSNEIQYPLKNIAAIKKNIKASYLFTENENFIKCDLLLKNCKTIILTDGQIYLALEQKLKDINQNELIFMGELDNFVNIDKQKDINNQEKNYIKFKITEDKTINLYGDIKIDFDEKLKVLDIKKYSVDGKILISNVNMIDWKIKFEDLTEYNSKINRRDKNGLSGCINIYDSSIKNLELYVNQALCEDAVNFVRTNGTIQKAIITKTLFDAIDADFSNINFVETKINDAGNDCIDFSFGIYTLSNSSFSGCGDKAISVGESSLLDVNNIKISNSIIGVASKDSSLTKLDQIYIDGVEICFSSYKKKQEFNGGYLKFSNLVCKNYDLFSNIDKHSQIIEIN